MLDLMLKHVTSPAEQTILWCSVQGLTRWRDKEFENLQPPPPPMPEPGKRRSARARAGTQFFTPTFGGPAKHARCATCQTLQE